MHHRCDEPSPSEDGEDEISGFDWLYGDYLMEEKVTGATTESEFWFSDNRHFWIDSKFES